LLLSSQEDDGRELGAQAAQVGYGLESQGLALGRMEIHTTPVAAHVSNWIGSPLSFSDEIKCRVFDPKCRVDVG
jgi:hypothetical protein